MDLKEVFDRAGQFGTEASNAARTLAFSGFAVIWVFKTGSVEAAQVAPEFYPPAYFLAASLALDLMQYVLGRIALVLFARYKEVFEKAAATDDFDYPVFILWPSRLCWWAKIAALLYAYYLLLLVLHARSP